mmetsp:Transcript_10094/g.17033  ORF Transcript_10094/g.17033 Transcript_10094/m.17033 type:complete len:167 (-) Transcript_10094:748-1248(-)
MEDRSLSINDPQLRQDSLGDIVPHPSEIEMDDRVRHNIIEEFTFQPRSNSTKSNSREKNLNMNKIAVLFAIATSIILGVSNFVQADISAKFGLRMLFLKSPPLIFQWLTFSLTRLIFFKPNSKAVSYFSKANSPYFVRDTSNEGILDRVRREDTLVLSWKRVLIPF